MRRSERAVVDIAQTVSARRLMEKAEQQEAEKLSFLRKDWQEGIDSGDANEVDFSVLKKEARARLAALEA